jgi:hypothetical protein
MNHPTLLEKLLQDFPLEERLRIREEIDRMNIRNPDDEIYRLMIVLGIWTKYYEGIPQKLLNAGKQVDAQNGQMLEAFDMRLHLLQKTAQEVQDAIDRLDGAPQAIVDKFPAEVVSHEIAWRINKDFIELSLTDVQKEIGNLNQTLSKLIAPQGKDGKPEDKSLIQKVQDDVGRLEKTAEKLSHIKFPRAPSPLRDIQVAFITFSLTLFVCWYAWNRPSMREVKELLQKEAFISQHVTVGTKNGTRCIMVPHETLNRTEEQSNGDVIILLKDKPGN